MRSDKFEKYADVLRELEAQSIDYLLATISCYGRRHPSVTQILTQSAISAARRKGIGSHSAILRRWFRQIVSEVWKRAAKMIRACMPRELAATEYLLAGEREA